MESSSANVASIIRPYQTRLSEPITDVDDLVETLKAPLDALGILPASSRPRITGFQPSQEVHPIHTQSLRLITSLQYTLLTNVVPSWDVPLNQQQHIIALDLIEQYFCPKITAETLESLNAYTSTLSTSFEIALSAFSVCLSTPESIGPFSLRILSRLLVAYPIDSMYMYLFKGRKESEKERRMLEWGFISL